MHGLCLAQKWQHALHLLRRFGHDVNQRLDVVEFFVSSY